MYARPSGQNFRAVGQAYTVAAQGFNLANVVSTEEVELQNEIRGIIGKYTTVEESAKGSIVAELKVALEKSFDLRQEARLQELKKLEEQLNPLEGRACQAVQSKRPNC